MSEPRNYCSTEMRCPYCGQAQMDPWERYDGDGDHMGACDECGQAFAFNVRTETWFDTYPVDKGGNMLHAESADEKCECDWFEEPHDPSTCPPAGDPPRGEGT